jgi:regulation of enolase protein 1 (concanavalin A-like superfamily)
MIRETLAAGSRHASAFATPSSGYAFQRRIDPGGITEHTYGPSGIPPGWVRLVRTGTVFEAFQSTDGTAWQSMGSDAVPMADTVYVGIATTSHNATAATDAVVDSFKVTQSGSTTNQPPSVAITSPTGGSTFTAGTNVTVTAAAADSDGTLSRVDFFVGTTQIGSDTTGPYSVTWSSVAAGTYTLTAKAVDSDGASTTSAAVSVQVTTAANQPPTVSLTAPANGASYAAPASISLAASASDADGTISKVEFYNGTTLLNTDTAAPYSYSWTNVAAGAYSLRAVAYDNAGASATSASASITVSSGTTIPSPWTAADIGSPALSGSSSYNSGVYSIDVGGVDIWDISDQFHFIYQPISGDVEIIARVDALTVADPYTNAGVMIRGTLDPSSLHGYSTLTGSNGVYFRRRLTNGGTTTSIQVAGVVAPTWVRLVRQGSVVTSYWSTDGSSWSAIGSQTLGLGTTAYVGLAASSHNATTRTNARFSNVRVGPPSSNQAPTVTLSSPVNGSTFTAAASVTLSANASDTDGTVSKVEFYNGATLLDTDMAAPYSSTWSNVAAGTYSVKAVAYDNSGASTSSATSTITVSTVTSSIPTGVIFTASPDHATLVTYYELRIYAPGANPSTATPIATSNLGKPTPDANSDITVNQSTFFSALTVGNYVAAVAAVGSGGSSGSTGVTFTR